MVRFSAVSMVALYSWLSGSNREMFGGKSGISANRLYGCDQVKGRDQIRTYSTEAVIRRDKRFHVLQAFPRMVKISELRVAGNVMQKCTLSRNARFFQRDFSPLHPPVLAEALRHLRNGSDVKVLSFQLDNYEQPAEGAFCTHRL